MAIIIDHERREIEALRQVADWRGVRTLEIGCGDGRLTLRLAELGAQVVAFDPDPTLIHQAQRNLPQQFSGCVKYYTGAAEQLSHPTGAFDAVALAWSL